MDPSDPLPSPGTTIAGRYRLEAELGSGAFGAVYRASRSDDGEAVAIKFLYGEALARPEFRKRFEREASALATIAHPHIIGVLELGDVEGTPFMVMELLEGTTLEDLLCQQHLEPSEALRIADQLLAGLGFAHAHGIVHRDLKPENIFLARQPDGRTVAKLLDFGLVKFTGGGGFGPQSILTQEGAILGTPAYMAPEQVYGSAIDARTDVYGAGVVLFELLTGTWPFVSEHTAELFRAHAMAPVPSLGEARPGLEAHPALEAVVQRALAKTPADRFADASEMRAALGQVPAPAARIVG